MGPRGPNCDVKKSPSDKKLTHKLFVRMALQRKNTRPRDGDFLWDFLLANWILLITPLVQDVNIMILFQGIGMKLFQCCWNVGVCLELWWYQVQVETFSGTTIILRKNNHTVLGRKT